MADFCAQCSRELFNEDYKELAGLISEEEVGRGLLASVLCEGCGAVQVNHRGECCSNDCDKKHGHPIPSCLEGIYSYREPVFQPYDASQGYHKKPCVVKLHDGKEVGPCWPNAGKFVPLESQSGFPEFVPEKDVKEIAYFIANDESRGKES